MQLQVIVNKLNKRSGPVTNFANKSNVIGVVNKGFTFESDAEIINDLGRWVKDLDGSYYWGSGVNVIATFPDTSKSNLLDALHFAFDRNKMSWAHDSVANGGLGIVELWNLMQTRGKGVKIAVIDTGASFANNDLKNKIDLSKSIDCLTFNNIDDTDIPEFHGTKSAGIVSSDGNNSNTVYGVAPESELIIYRLFNNSGLDGYTDENFRFVLQEARKAKVDIITMSFITPDRPIGIDSEIKACIDQNILLIAAAGDQNQNLGIKNNFPASLPGCISVGAYRILDQQPIVYFDHSCKSDFLFCLGPGEDILTTGVTATPTFHHFTSAAAPFISGVIALMLSFRKIKNLPISVDVIKDQLKKSCVKIDKKALKDEIEGFGILEPTKLFNLIKS